MMLDGVGFNPDSAIPRYGVCRRRRCKSSPDRRNDSRPNELCPIDTNHLYSGLSVFPDALGPLLLRARTAPCVSRGDQSHSGGFNSLESQPAAFDLSGSEGNGARNSRMRAASLWRPQLLGRQVALDVCRGLQLAGFLQGLIAFRAGLHLPRLFQSLGGSRKPVVPVR